VERSVFLFEPQERTWGVKGAEQIQLAPGQTYAAALLHRPANYWLNRLLRPISSTVSGESGALVLGFGGWFWSEFVGSEWRLWVTVGTAAAVGCLLSLIWCCTLRRTFYSGS
jgi:hypothetical protein